MIKSSLVINFDIFFLSWYYKSSLIRLVLLGIKYPIHCAWLSSLVMSEMGFLQYVLLEKGRAFIQYFLLINFGALEIIKKIGGPGF